MHIDIEIYLNKLKSYIQTNEEAKSYFVGKMDIDFFIEKVKDYAIKNFEKNGDPLLSFEQFEEIKETNDKKISKTFFNLKDFGDICLN